MQRTRLSTRLAACCWQAGLSGTGIRFWAGGRRRELSFLFGGRDADRAYREFTAGSFDRFL